MGDRPRVSLGGLVVCRCMGGAGPEPPAALLQLSDALRLAVLHPVLFVSLQKRTAKQSVAVLHAAVQKNRSP